MANKSQQAKLRHENKNNPEKPFYSVVGNMICDEETQAWLTEHEKRVTFAPNFLLDTFYTAYYKDWGDDDEGGGKKKW